MTIPTNLLQSQLALNKKHLFRLHNYEEIMHETWRESGMGYPASELERIKKQIAKYALLQKAIKQALREAAYNAKYFSVDCEDF